MVSHEYGSQYFRPHHHAIIFGYNPNQQYNPRTTKSGESIFQSHELEKLWTNGYSSVGTANERTAYYIASYSLKGKKHSIVLPNGDIADVSDAFDASKRPAIGYNYFIQNQQQLVDCGEAIPRYYLKKLQEQNPTLHEHYENNRQFKVRGSHELLAKYVIDQEKISHSSEFRSAPQEFTKERHLLKQLEDNRNDYQFHKKD